jgi:hypothetical protein
MVHRQTIPGEREELPQARMIRAVITPVKTVTIVRTAGPFLGSGTSE